MLTVEPVRGNIARGRGGGGIDRRTGAWTLGENQLEREGGNKPRRAQESGIVVSKVLHMETSHLAQS